MRLFVFAAVWLFLANPSPAADVAPPAKYQAAVKALESWLEREVAAKKIPALSIALVDDQTVVWSRGFGHADPLQKTPATADTLYRVGSVSKPFTVLLLMLFVELGLIDLDMPVQEYVPDFQPVNKTAKKITLRQMVSHRSGLVREAPVGNYFDASEPSLADTVKSLNKTELVYVPETKTSYSNAAVATVGYVLERTRKERFEKLMQRKLLDPLGMKDSGFDPPAELRKRVAKAEMWTYTGRTFPAPTWELGLGPAGNLYSSANDQAKLLRFLFAGGKGPDGQVMKKETLDRMLDIQFGKKGDKAGFGLGFFVSEMDGKRRIGHAGAVYGFATELAALPDDKLGVVVCASKDVANGVTYRAGALALRHMLAVRAGQPLPAIEETTPVDRDLVRKLAGRYQAGKKTIELYQRDGHLWLFPYRSGERLELRQQGKALVIDDVQGFGARFIPEGTALAFGKEKYQRMASAQPKPPPDKWQGLIGEYGPDHSVLYILEKDGRLHALIEWTALYPLTEASENVFKFPDFGMYHGDKIVFNRDKTGLATEAEAASVRFVRRPFLKQGETFKIKPVRPLAELRKEALAAQPPKEKNAFHRKPDLVDLTVLDKSIKLDIRYASDNNFLGTPFYTSARAYLQRPAAEALVRADKKLEAKGYGLLIHDGYRPWHVTRMFWDATPAQFHMFVADPLQGSRHNRGCAVDLTLYERKTGKAVDMPGGYDEMSERSYADYLGGTSLQRWHRDLLRNAMEEEGFSVYEAEWWHFDYRDWRQYGILNTRFEDLK